MMAIQLSVNLKLKSLQKSYFESLEQAKNEPREFNGVREELEELKLERPDEVYEDEEVIQEILRFEAGSDPNLGSNNSDF